MFSRRKGRRFNRGRGSAGSAGAFTPASLTRLIAWYEADLGLDNQVAGSPIGSLVETGGTVENAAAGGPNGIPTWRFYAASGGYLTTGVTSTQIQPYTEIVVFQFRGTPTTNGAVCGSPNSRIIRHSTAGTIQAGPSGYTSPGTISGDTWYCVDWQPRTTYQGVRFATATSYVTSVAHVSSHTGVVLGATSSGAARSDVDVAMYFLFDGAPTDADMTALMQYIADKTALAVVAPSSGFYKPTLPAFTKNVTGLHAMLCAGQSNMAGGGTAGVEAFSASVFCYQNTNDFNTASHAAWIPAISSTNTYYPVMSIAGTETCMAPFANDIVAATAGEYGLIQSAKNGAGSDNWAPTTQSLSGHVDGTGMLEALLHRAAQFIAQGGIVDGAIVIQVENDITSGTSAAVYQARYQAFIDAVRSTTGNPALPVWLVKLDRAIDAAEPQGVIFGAIDSLVAANSNVYAIAPSEIAGAHYTGAEGNTLGAEIYTAVNAVMGWS